MIKIDIISGFLGAGKTTLIQKLLDEAYAGEKIALIENEFGEVGIDGGFLRDSGVNITEMNSGCICCSLVGDFGKNLHEVITTYHPDRIVIEPSGVGKLSDVMKSVIEIENAQDVKLNALVTVVNAKKALKQMKAFGEFFNNQITYATTIVLSRTQHIPSEQLQLCVKQMQELNPEAAVVTTPWEELSGGHLLQVMEGEDCLEKKAFAKEACRREEEAHAHHHDCGAEQHGYDCGHKEQHGHGCCGEEHPHDHACGSAHHQEHGCCHEGHQHGHTHHHAEEVFTSWGKETPRKYTRAEIEGAVKAFAEGDAYGTVLRAKGIVENAEGGWMYFDMTPGEYEIRDGEPDYTGRLCVIGTDLKEEKLEELFYIV